MCCDSELEIFMVCGISSATGGPELCACTAPTIWELQIEGGLKPHNLPSTCSLESAKEQTERPP